MKETETENKRLKQNYEIIKEHEMSIIRDLENKKHVELKQQDSTIQRERENFLEVQHKGVILNNEIANLKQIILTLENDIRIAKSEHSSLQDKTDKKTTEYDSLKYDCVLLRSK